MACQNCREVVEVMRQELDELVERERQLQRINDALIEAINQQTPDDIKWKEKYQEQVTINQTLEKQLRELARAKRKPLGVLSSNRRHSQ